MSLIAAESSRAMGSYLMPTTDELKGISCIMDLAQWVPMQPDVSDSLFTFLGMHGADPIRILGIMDSNSYNDLISNWTVIDRAPTPSESYPASILGRVARGFCGTPESAAPAAQATPIVGDTSDCQETL